MENSGAAIVRNISGRHGEVRGLSLSRRSSQFEGRFGRMFRSLCAAEFDEDILMELGAAMTAAREDPPTAETELDDEENIGTEDDSGISAGYTYLGQFIDHDLTFDPVSNLQRQNDPDGLTDYRTPLCVDITRSVIQNQQLTFASAVRDLTLAVGVTTIGQWSISCWQCSREWAHSSGHGPISLSRFLPCANRWRYSSGNGGDRH